MAAAYVKPDADLGAYGRVMILDTYVAFRKNWARDQNRSSIYKILERCLAGLTRSLVAVGILEHAPDD